MNILPTPTIVMKPPLLRSHSTRISFPPNGMTESSATAAAPVTKSNGQSNESLVSDHTNNTPTLAQQPQPSHQPTMPMPIPPTVSVTPPTMSPTMGVIQRAPSLTSIVSTSSASPAPTPLGGFGSGLSLASSGSGDSTDSIGSISTMNLSSIMQPVTLQQAHPPMTSATPQPHGSVHVIWNVVDVPFPSSLPPAYAIERVQRIAESYGSIASFKALCYSDMNQSGGSGNTLSMAIKKCLHDHGMELEEVYRQANSPSIDLAVMTNILRIAMIEVEQQVQSQYQRGGGSGHGGSMMNIRGSTLILLSNQSDFGRALHVLRRSGRFVDVIVIYHHPTSSAQTLLPMHAHEPVSLIRHATVSFEWSQLLRHGLPPQTMIAFESQSRPSSGNHQRSTSLKDLPSLAQPHQHSGSVSSSAQSSYPSSAASSGFNSRASTPLSGRSSNISSTPLLPNSVSNYASTTNSRSSSISSHPSMDSHASSSTNTTIGGPNCVGVSHDGRSMMGAVLDVSTAFESNTTNLGELTVELMLERLAPKIRSMVLAFKSVLQYCEQERIIPRESVLKKRLLDTSVGLGTQLADVDFEHLLELAVNCGIAAVEGQAPQRIIYPGTGCVDPKTGASMRKFECADFFQPTQRLTVDQTEELLVFLNRTKPEVDRGRFGFAQFLSINSPPTIKSLPHGVLVELVQLLLNQKILLFRKGRVSTSPNLGYADLHALAALSVASKPHTALLSTTKGPQGQQAASQLRLLYAQLQHDIDAFNAIKMEKGSTFTSQDQGGQTTRSNEQLSRTSSTRSLSAPTSPALPASGSRSLSSSWSTNPSEVGDDSCGFHLPQESEFDPALIQSSGSNRSSRSNSIVLDPALTIPESIPTATIVHSSMTWSPTPPFEKSNQISYAQIFAHKFLQSKWGELSQPLLSQQQRFPFVALWHMDLSMMPVSGSQPIACWSATCTFDISDELHSFSATTIHSSAAGAQEALSKQMLEQPVMWKLSWNCMLQEIKTRRCVTSTAPVNGQRKKLPFLIKDQNELLDIERDETEIHARTEKDIQYKLLSNPILQLDSLLSALVLPPMIYSCEQVEISIKSSKRLVWSVAGALPMSTDTSASATSLKDSKYDAKLECAKELLERLRQFKLPSPQQQQQKQDSSSIPTASSSIASCRPIMNPKAAEWCPKQLTPNSSASTVFMTPAAAPTESASSVISPLQLTASIATSSGMSSSITTSLPMTHEEIDPCFDPLSTVDDETDPQTPDEEEQYLTDWAAFANHQANVTQQRATNTTTTTNTHIPS